jgi:restriction endonuclease S subunit
MSNTVPIVQIGDLIQTKNDKSKQLQTGEYLLNGVVPIVDQGSKPICGYTNDLSKSYEKGLPVVIFGDHTLHTKFIDFRFAIGADGTQVLTPKSKDCDTKYLYFLISRAAGLIGSEGYKRHFKILKEFDIEYIESLPEQQKIAAILSSVDNVIETTRAQIDKLKYLKAGMMQELLTKGIGSNGVAHNEFKDSPFGQIPLRWEVSDLDKLVSVDKPITYGIVQAGPNCKDGVPYIRVSDMSERTLNLKKMLRTAPEVAEKYKRSAVTAGDIVYALRGMIGHVHLVPSELDGANLTQGTARISPKDQIYSRYLLWAMQAPYVQYQNELEAKGSTFREVTLASLRKIQVLVPPRDEQLKIASIFDSIRQKLIVTEDKLSQFQSLKKALIQDLLTGKVRVNIEEKEKEPAVA